MWKSGASKRKQDFFIDQGVPAYTKRGNDVLSGFKTLIWSAVTVISTVFDGMEAEPDSLIALGEKFVITGYINFCLSYIFRPACAFYGRNQASIFVDLLFWKFFDRLPKDKELFQRYLDLQLFPDDDHEKHGKLSGPIRFIFDILGRSDVAPLAVLPAVGMQLALDGKELLEAADPITRANELAQTFPERVAEWLYRTAAE